MYRDRPRGIVAAGVEEPNALLQVARRLFGTDGARPRPSLVEGLSARTLAGLGHLDPTPDPATYDKVFVHTDVLVIGAGPQAWRRR